MTDSSAEEIDVAKTLTDIAKGEMTASALENQLNALESKVDELLAGFQSCGPPHHEETAKDEETGKKQDKVNSDERSR